MVGQELLERHCEQFLRPLGLRRVKAGTLVEHGDVSEADPGLRCGSRQRVEHLHARRGGRRVPVQVVKLGDRCVAAEQHLRVRLAGNRVQQAGIEHCREFVHALAPGPEAVVAGRRTLLGAAGQRSLESMAVGIAESRYDAAGHDRSFSRRLARRDVVNQPIAYPQQDVVRPAVRQQRFPGKK
jgi:hypothetical protein